MNDMRKYMDLINSIESGQTVTVPSSSSSSSVNTVKPSMLVETIKNDISVLFEDIAASTFANSLDITIHNAREIDNGVTPLNKLKSIVESLGGFISVFDYHFNENDSMNATVVFNDHCLDMGKPTAIVLDSIYEKIKCQPWDTRIKQLGFGEFSKEDFRNTVLESEISIISDDTFQLLKEKSVLGLISNNHYTIDNMKKDIPIVLEGNGESWLIHGAVVENVQRIISGKSKGVVIRWDGDQNALVSK